MTKVRAGSSEVRATATDELRRLLDERGVEYETYIEQPTGFEHVKWNFNEHGSADFNLEFGEPWLTMYGVISGPEQAIAATLGRGECRLEEIEKDCDTASEYMLDREFCFDAVYRCSCGCRFGHVAHERPKFCPSCGRHIKED